MNLRHNLIDFLNDHGLESLSFRGIRVGHDERYPNLFNLKYGAVGVNKLDPIVCACRGAVVERVDNDGDHSPYFRLVAYAFDRFFNLGEGGAAPIDWSTAVAYEKYDGSLIKLFHWNGMWIVSTSGSVGGAGEVGSSGKSFEELFWETFDYCDYYRMDLDTDNCYVFELCCPENRVVVDYERPQLRLLAVRNRWDDFAELPLGDFADCFYVAQSFLFDAEEVVDRVNARGAEHEGFVVRDGEGNRVKVKSDVYVQLHRVRGNGEPDFSKLYLNGDLDEFLLHFPEYGEKFCELLDCIDTLSWMVESFVRAYAHLDDANFAKTVLEHHKTVSGAMFGLRRGKISKFSEFVSRMTPKQLDSLLGLG